MHEIHRKALEQQALRWLHESVKYDECQANVKLVADEFEKYDPKTADYQRIFKQLVAKNVLIPNQELKEVFAKFYRNHPEYAGIQANDAELMRTFIRPDGRPTGVRIVIEALENHLKLFGNQLSKNQQAIDAEQATKHAVNTGKRNAEETLRLVKEIMSGYKISRNPYTAEPGKLTQRQYDEKEQSFYDLPLDDLRNQHATIMAKRSMRGMSSQDLRLKVRQEYEKNTNVIERFLPLPKSMVFSPEIHPRVVDAALLRWIAANDMPRYKLFLERYGAQAISDRIDGKD